MNCWPWPHRGQFERCWIDFRSNLHPRTKQFFIFHNKHCTYHKPNLLIYSDLLSKLKTVSVCLLLLCMHHHYHVHRLIVAILRKGFVFECCLILATVPRMKVGFVCLVFFPASIFGSTEATDGILNCKSMWICKDVAVT